MQSQRVESQIILNLNLWEKQILLDRTDYISSMFFSNHYFGGSSASVDFFLLDEFFFIVLALESILCCLLYQWPENASKSVISTTMMIVLFPLQVYNSHHACTLFYWMLYLNINSHNHFCEKWLYSSLHVEAACDATMWECVKMLDNVLRNRKKQPNNKKLHEYLCYRLMRLAIKSGSACGWSIYHPRALPRILII